MGFFIYKEDKKMGIFEDIFNERQKKVVLTMSVFLFLIIVFDVAVKLWTLLAH